MPLEDDRRLYLTLDQGGHASRALVFDAHGVALAKGLREVGVYRPRAEWVEQDAEELVASLRAAIDDALSSGGIQAAQIAAVGLATQRSSIACWDRITGAALAPVISWQDRRAHHWLMQFAPQAAAIQATTGLPLSPHYGASKLRWCLDHLPAVSQAQSQGRLACGPLASFLIFRLTQEHSFLVDPANGGRTLLCNLATQDWDAGLLKLFGIPLSALPTCVQTRHAFGNVEIGKQSVPLRVVTGDQSAALFAQGAPRVDSAYINLGTGAFVQRLSENLPGPQAQLLTSIVLQEQDAITYALEGTVNGAGAALQWIETQLGIEDLEQQLPQWLAESSEPPLFLNAVGGLGAPFWVANFESRFVGAGEPWQKVVAVAESIVFLLQANLEIMARSAPLEKIVASGGLTWYDGLCQRLSDLSGLPLHRSAEYEATARGTAWLLAGKPTHWAESQPGLWFQPCANAPLQARYRRWRAALHAALSA